MSRELQSDTVSSADRSSGADIADEQPASQVQQQDAASESVAIASDAVPTAAEVETNPVEAPSAASNESSSLNCDNESTRIVSICAK